MNEEPKIDVSTRHRHNLAKWLEELEETPTEMLSEKDRATMEHLQKMKESYSAVDEFSKNMRSRQPYYDRKGNPITFWEWSGYISDLEYKIIKQDTFGPFFVSTVWLGMDHGLGRFFVKEEEEQPLPIIFETMIFDESEEEGSIEKVRSEIDCYQERHCSEKQALRGHEEACQIAAAYAFKLYNPNANPSPRNDRE